MKSGKYLNPFGGKKLQKEVVIIKKLLIDTQCAKSAEILLGY